MTDPSKMKAEDLPPDISQWSKHQVREWALKLDAVGEPAAEILFKEDISGRSLLCLDTKDLTTMGVTYGPAKLIIHARDEVLESKKEGPKVSTNQPGPRKPYPFCRYHDPYRYMESSILDTIESSASDLIEPCHEYKAFVNTTDCTEEDKVGKFTYEVIRFAAACMNSRTNGTIHFGIGDKPDYMHGEVLGVVVENREAYEKALRSAIDCCFEHKHKEAAQFCIKPVRFVGILNRNSTTSNKCVMEVDIVPDSTVCKENFYHTFNMDRKAKKKAKDKETVTKPFFVRHGGSSCNLNVPTTDDKSMKRYGLFVDNMEQRSQLRKEAEEKHLSTIKSSTQGSRLCQMITGGSLSLERSHFERYVIVTNKAHPSQCKSLEFLVELDPTAVLDLDPESANNGLQWHFQQQNTVNVHLPEQYKITERAEDIANKLELTRNTSWIFCNGGIEEVAPSDIDHWLMDKGASVRDVISFLCRKDVLPNKRFLVIFLLWSTVSDEKDPLVETFSTFCQELRGTQQILCICDNEKAFTSWRDLIEARYGVNISDRCIYELSFNEINGTILSLWSKNRRSIRFLPCGGGSKVPVEKKMERSLKTLEVLCVNQCEGGNEDKIAVEETFYRGGKVSWWNFHFSEQPGSTPFIKRDMFDYIMNTVIPDLRSLGKACVLFNLIHVPGCGGTTLAMHTLWALRDKFRCAVLKNNNADFAEVADQVVRLLRYDCEEQLPRLPVLLMIDDFDDRDKVFDLQQLIEKECTKKAFQSKSAQVLLLNCMRSESFGLNEPTSDTVYIRNKLSEKEKKLFEEKLKEIEKTHKNTETFYGFMIMKPPTPQYVEGVVHNTLRSFSKNQKHAKLLAVLALLNVYCRGASLSISLCEEYLGLQPKPFCGTIKVEEGFGKFSTLITTCSVEGNVVFKAVKMIHFSFAKQCLQELKATHNMTKADIADLLLTTGELYESTQGRDKLLQDVYHILVKRNHSLQEESHFSPLIQNIANETPGLEEMVLKNGSKRYEEDAVVSQLLARYCYLKKKDFSQAKIWAEKAKHLSKDNSYIADTSAQVIKHELKNAIAKHEGDLISPEKLEIFLKMAQSAIDAFKETQSLAKRESSQRSNKTKTNKVDNCPFNTAGYLGEIQVGVLVIHMLVKTPIFSKDNVRHDIMSQVLSGEMKIQDVEKNDQRHNKHRRYYMILREFDDLLYNLRYRMKLNFDFLDNFYVNLGSRFGIKDSREQVAQNELLKCFTNYAMLFCKTDSKAQWKSKALIVKMKLHEAKQFLEKQKADNFSGILNCLSNDIPAEKMETIARHNAFVCAADHNPTMREKINFIYVNVVLSRIKLESQLILPYQELMNLLHKVLREPIPLNDTLPMLFIAVVLLWPQQGQPGCRSLGQYISQIKTSYYAEMREVYNGKRPTVHFFLGKKHGYERLVPLGEIKRAIMAEQEQFASMWENGKIWKERKVEELLCRVTGQVMKDSILADTCIPDLKVDVTPMFRCQLSGYSEGSKVSFFIGFSIKGPLALDITPP